MINISTTQLHEERLGSGPSVSPYSARGGGGAGGGCEPATGHEGNFQYFRLFGDDFWLAVLLR